jgi:hypothetical protein
MRARTRRPHPLSPIAWAILALAVAGFLSLSASLQYLVAHTSG